MTSLRGSRSHRVRRGEEVGRGEVARREAEQRSAQNLEPEARRVGQREPPHVAVIAVLLRQDVRHVLALDRVPERRDDRGRAPVLVVVPRPPPEPLELLEARHEHEHDADTREVAEIRPDPNLVLDEQASASSSR